MRPGRGKVAGQPIRQPTLFSPPLSHVQVVDPYAPEPVSDAELIDRVLAGDPSAERELYDAHVDRVFRLVYRMAGDLDRAQDWVQETFIRAFQKLDEFRGESALSTWLCSIAISVSLNGLRKVKRFREREVALDDAVPVGFTPREADPDLKVRLAEAIDDLPDGYRAVFVMHDVEGFTHEEIGRTLGVQPGTSKAQLFRARAKLRDRPRRLRKGPGPMSDDQLDERLREAARAYNAPPETPREEMWARIQAGRRRQRRPCPGLPARAACSGWRPRQPRSWRWESGSAGVSVDAGDREVGGVGVQLHDLPAGRPGAPGSVGGVPHPLPGLGGGADRSPAGLGFGTAAPRHQPAAAGLAGRGRAGRPDCCWRIWSWCSRRSRSSRLGRERRTCSSFVMAWSGAT